MEFVKSDQVENIINSYPQSAKERLKEVRKLIIETARETKGLDKLLETTKWGEPSYVSRNGSTLRMDWKEKTPDKYYLFFICNTDLVSNFRMIFGDELQYEGNRAIVLNLDEPLPEVPLRKCISYTLNYHKIKHLPMLGA